MDNEEIVQVEPTQSPDNRGELLYKITRYTILLISVMSVINLALTIFLGRYFYFATYITRIVAQIGNIYFTRGSTRLVIITIVVGIVLIVPYILSFVFSSTRKNWQIVALVLFSADMLIFVYDFISFIVAGYMPVNYIIDLLTKLMILALMIINVVKGREIDKEREYNKEDTVPDFIPQMPIHRNDFSVDLGKVKRKLFITKKTDRKYKAVICECVIDGVNRGALKDNHTAEYIVSANSHNFKIIATNGKASKVITVPAGAENKTYDLVYEFTAHGNAIPVLVEKN
ncbi:MAG: hypothetical protein J6B34_00015 [Clostridia bacterium]|nr:hypothetical protein [Clostridia bacterium]